MGNNEKPGEIPEAGKSLINIQKDLSRKSSQMFFYGICLLALGIGFAIKFLLFMLNLTDDLFIKITGMHQDILDKENTDHSFEDLSSIIYFLGFRTFLLGAIGGMIIFFILKFSKSCFDQSTRFVKRKHATQFLEYVSTANIDIEKHMQAFYIWNLNVESAFSAKGIRNKRPFSLKRLFEKTSIDEKGETPKEK